MVGKFSGKFIDMGTDILFCPTDGKVNEGFRKYCLDQGLHTVLTRALRMLFAEAEFECQRKENPRARSPTSENFDAVFSRRNPTQTSEMASPGGTFSKGFSVFGLDKGPSRKGGLLSSPCGEYFHRKPAPPRSRCSSSPASVGL